MVDGGDSGRMDLDELRYLVLKRAFSHLVLGTSPSRLYAFSIICHACPLPFSCTFLVLLADHHEDRLHITIDKRAGLHQIAGMDFRHLHDHAPHGNTRRGELPLLPLLL